MSCASRGCRTRFAVLHLVLAQLTMPARYDRNAPIRRPVRHDSGFLRVEAHLTRTGVFEYRTGDGKVRRELRLASEVFKQDALDSFAGVPVTDEHPPVMLTGKNAKKFSVGSVGETVRRDGDLVLASLAVHDADAIKAVESGERSEVSCGYHCDLDETPGTHEGKPYDAVQKNIRGNHVALVAKGRAGRDARIHLDAADAVEADDDEAPPPKPRQTRDTETQMEKVLINGIWVEVSATAKQALEVEKGRKDAELEKLQVELKAATAKAEKETARADSLKEDLAKAEKARKDAAEPAALQARIDARLQLERDALKVLGKGAKLSGLPDQEIKLKVLAKARPTAKLDGKSEAYLDGAFEAVVDAAHEDSDDDDAPAPKGGNLEKVRQQLVHQDDEDGDDESAPAWMKADSDKARAEYLKRMDAAAKPVKQ